MAANYTTAVDWWPQASYVKPFSKARS